MFVGGKIRTNVLHTKEGKIMLKKQQKPTNAPLHNNNEYSSFDDFTNFLLTCSQEQFECTYAWFRKMRKNNIEINLESGNKNDKKS